MMHEFIFHVKSHFFYQMHQEEDQGFENPDAQGLSLRQLNVWMYDPLVRLKTLAALVDVCQGI